MDQRKERALPPRKRKDLKPAGGDFVPTNMSALSLSKRQISNRRSEDVGSGPTPGGPAGKVFGVLGGMGPLASAEFLRTIYEVARFREEQEAPRVVLLSEPSVPDRTIHLRSGNPAKLLWHLEQGLGFLSQVCSQDIVICCITIHSILPLVVAPLRARVLSLVQLILRSVVNSPERHLLLCTKGTRDSKVFQKDPLWSRAAARIVWPSEEDQQAVHRILYELKSGAEPASYCPWVSDLAGKYYATSVIAGCTELHLVSKRMQSGAATVCWVDPLLDAARHICDVSRRD
jgi:aspartate racemase